MPVANVIQLRALLSEKFPGLRQHLNSTSKAQNPRFPIPKNSKPGILNLELIKGALMEIVGKNSGSATLLRELLYRAAKENQIVALIDGSDSFDVTQIAEDVLSRVLWIRCHQAGDALKAADLVLRDGNLPLVLLDLKSNSEKELRKIPATTWYRFQRLVEETNAVCVVFTPRQMISSAQKRITVRSHFSIADLECDTGELLHQLEMEISDERRFEDISEPATA